MSNSLAWADLVARVDAAAFGIPVSWPNQEFDLPQDSDARPLPFLAVELEGGASRPIELGGSTWQAEGRTMVHVLVPTGSGVDAAFDLVDAVVAMFRGPPLEPVIYTDISADAGGAGTEDGLWWRTSVTASWRAQTFVPRA